VTPERSLLLMACALGACKEPEEGVASPWQVEAADLGAPRASGATLTVGDGAGLWSPLSQVVPFLEYDDPASDVPFFLWDLATSDRVADMGSCPDVQAVGRTTTWTTYGCRSSQGYEWTGEVSKEEWDDDARGWRYARWDFDLDVEADIDAPRFDALSLHGSVLYVIGDGAALDHAVQVNAAIQLDGYWARQNPSDDREDLWNDWTVTARYEEAPTDTYRVDGAAELGSAGAFSFSSASLKRATTCPAVPDGTLSIDGAQSAELTFNGSTACSSCADLDVVGGAGGRACRD
jgi:hypothetical protein